MNVSKLTTELTQLLNRHSAENASNTPDFILAEFIISCLSAFNTGVTQRDAWYGDHRSPGQMRTSDEDRQHAATHGPREAMEHGGTHTGRFSSGPTGDGNQQPKSYTRGSKLEAEDAGRPPMIVMGAGIPPSAEQLDELAEDYKARGDEAFDPENVRAILGDHFQPHYIGPAEPAAGPFGLFGDFVEFGPLFENAVRGLDIGSILKDMAANAEPKIDTRGGRRNEGIDSISSLIAALRKRGLSPTGRNGNSPGPGYSHRHGNRGR